MIYLDTETSGLKYTHQITQIAAMAEDGTTFHRRLFFDLDNASPEALEVNHFDRALWEKTAVDQDQGRAEFLEWLRHHCDVPKLSKAGKEYRIVRACAYNASFDERFIKSWMWDGTKYLFCPIDRVWLDPLPFVREYMPELANHRLTTVAEALGIPTAAAHDAMGDVVMLRYVWEAIQPAIAAGRARMAEYVPSEPVGKPFVPAPVMPAPAMPADDEAMDDIPF